MVGLEVIKSPPQGAGGGQRAKASGGRGWGLGSWRSEATRPQSISSPPREWGGAASCRTDRPERPSARGEDGRRERGEGWGRGCRYAHVAELKRTQRATFLRGTSKKGAAGRTLSAMERLSSYDNIDTYPLSLCRWNGEGAPCNRHKDSGNWKSYLL